jgi:hypothetical protein
MFGRTLNVSAVSVCLALLVAAIPASSLANNAGSSGTIAHASSCPVDGGVRSRDAAFVENTYSHDTGLRTSGLTTWKVNACTWFHVQFNAGTRNNPRRCTIRYSAFWKGGKLRLIRNYLTGWWPGNCPHNKAAFLPYSDEHL